MASTGGNPLPPAEANAPPAIQNQIHQNRRHLTTAPPSILPDLRDHLTEKEDFEA
ncbi:hypothetical protein ASPBRDRAFT_47020 [Aspergillus brasiliensis CBS 101740]|uniref:Uncharacterized protein n=1 Tax=Aspergillus brasiliensis (strain CBS 101740 / IMI 381727 / IBT 21946) TaxID=767769 RepID=A0A1L9U8R9_ASPBC|nr:hypothetical protein ASPBRDRAFT_47020 [Aspergillus brasiliensis CBS 101740]